MPVDLQPPGKPTPHTTLQHASFLDRSLNWLALIVGIGLCVWSINYGSSLLS